MSRLLIVHSDPATRRELTDPLTREGHAVLDAADGVAALAWVRASTVDLVLADLRLRDPDVVAVRTAVRRASARAGLPFVFLAAPAERDAALLARVADEDLHLVHRPFDLAALSRLLSAILAGAPRQDGGFADSSLDALLFRIEAHRLSGVLSAFRDETTKKVVFRDGEMIFAGSSDPRELIGQAFVSAGLIGEDELKEAMARQLANHEPLAKVLQKLARITAQQADETVRTKFEECVLDLCLWTEGAWSFTAGIPDVPPSQSLSIALAGVRAEAVKRRTRWKAMRQMLPNDEVFFTVDEAKLATRKTATPAEKKLAGLAAGRASIAQIKLEVRGTDYAVYSRLTELVREGVLAPSHALPAPTDAELEAAARALVIQSAVHAGKQADAQAALSAIQAESDVVAEAEEKIGQAGRALAENRIDDARLLYRSALALDPANPYARRGLAEIDQQREKRIRELGITPARTAIRKLRIEDTPNRGLRPEAAFVLSRIEPWGTRIADLLTVTPLPEIQVLEIVGELVSMAVVTLT